MQIDEFIKCTLTAFFGVGVSYGIFKTEIKAIKEQIKSTNMYGERLAAIEAKLDILIKGVKI